MHYAATQDVAMSPRSRYVKAKHAALNSYNAVKRVQHSVVYRPHPDGLLVGSDGSITDNFSGFVLAPRLVRGKATVRASRKGIPHTWQVAKLVVEAFHGAMPRKRAFIEHINNDAMNCACENIRLVFEE
jgi:hypothetical protein